MRKFSIVLITGLMALAFSSAARADTTIYTTSELSGGVFVDNPDNSLGIADAAVATLGGFGWIAYQTDALFTALDLTVELTGVSGSTTLAIFAGTTNGSGGFSQLRFQFFEAVNGTNNIVSNGLSNFCSNIGGCDTFIVFNFERNSTLSLDSADLTANLVSAAPEPGTWALMMIGFAFVAWRLKQAKKKGALKPRLPKAAGVLAAA